MSEPNNSPTLVRAKCFHTLDAYVRLITLLVKHSGETQNTVTKVNLLNKVLGIVAGVLLIDHEVRQTNFQQVPYHRIFIMLFLELNSPDAILENINFQVNKHNFGSIGFPRCTYLKFLRLILGFTGLPKNFLGCLGFLMFFQTS